MKKTIITLVVAAGMLYAPVQAQDQKSTVCLNVGVSLVGQILSVADNGSTATLPAFQLTYDYDISNWFSLGLAGSYQLMGIDYEDYSYIDENNEVVYEDFTTDITRMNFALRALFHYGNFDRIDMYSGVRLGYTNWGFSSDSSDPLYDSDDVLKGGGFAPQVVAFGIRGYFTDNIGINVELAIGPPSYMSAGLNFRF
jgi:opacity protein-like surface antigen